MGRRALPARPGLGTGDAGRALVCLLCCVLPHTAPQVLRIG
ncbi:hypothetical protein VULLAG_LOCUS21702 [Vulpes lagopus]